MANKGTPYPSYDNIYPNPDNYQVTNNPMISRETECSKALFSYIQDGSSPPPTLESLNCFEKVYPGSNLKTKLEQSLNLTKDSTARIRIQQVIAMVIIRKMPELTDEMKANIINNKILIENFEYANLQKFVDEEWKIIYPVSSFMSSSPKIQGGRTLRRRRSSRRSIKRQRIRRTRRRV